MDEDFIDFTDERTPITYDEQFSNDNNMRDMEDSTRAHGE